MVMGGFDPSWEFQKADVTNSNVVRLSKISAIVTVSMAMKWVATDLQTSAVGKSLNSASLSGMAKKYLIEMEQNVQSFAVLWGC